MTSNKIRETARAGQKGLLGPLQCTRMYEIPNFLGTQGPTPWNRGVADDL